MLYITQPTYLPWIGFFAFIQKCKKVVFLDDVQFVRRDWQQRNKIYKNDSYQYLTAPVKKKNLYHQKLSDVVVNETFYDNHLKTIRHTYLKSRYFNKIYSELESLKKEIFKTQKLSQINIILIKKILDLLNINVDIQISSDLKTSGIKSYKLVDICKKLNQTELLNNEGSKEYILNDKNIFIENNINLFFFKYVPIKYYQPGKKFVSHLSILDLLFNEGLDCKEILINGLKEI